MAHAARLNLRMQKELKLLLADPPPGASFPFLSTDSDLTSLSTTHAQIEGPEGTVYAKGVFDIKIQIPERYPFQPPSVTFATPIYHPNIDNGGRICLDILNLPPKGAWQPSLNISTVLISIGLLLSEPNPDDGLMCEASREYKYNRQVFDQKARSMTEKYAKGGASRNNCSTQGVWTNLNPSEIESRVLEESRLEVSDIISSHDKQCGISQKSSLESSSSSQSRDCDTEVNENEAKGKRKNVNITLDEWNLRREKPCGIRRKLSLESSCQILRDGHNKENVVLNETSLCSPQTISATSLGSSVLQPSNFSQQKFHQHKDTEFISSCMDTSPKQLHQFNQKRSLSSLGTFQLSDDNSKKMLKETQVLSSQSPNASCRAPSIPLSVNGNKLEPSKEFADRTGNGSTDVKFKKVLSFGKTLSLGFKGSSQGQENDNKENVPSIHKQPLSGAETSSTAGGIGRKLSLGPLTQLQRNNDNNGRLVSHSEGISTESSMSVPLRKHHGCNNKKQSNQNHGTKVAGEPEQQKTVESPISEGIVVLDSEDSEDEKEGILISKLRLARKRLGNDRAKA